ncbi:MULTISPECIES: hypothetical protein [Vibrio]|uniref:DUF4412 domain-containing protein n=2 Tax=Vibrio TaxID=662 RepID=A0AAU9QUQ4_9VIBR|nr:MULTISPECIES: hypothetical protein [Vibrio]CAH1589269.1 conserved exported hypothetical protein [Vibrio jasicida]MCZ2798936.1 hypothetical protein [Vibrio alginolyticus]PAW02349.1 hypothetical protein CKJ79_16945 [Vibrio coralliilyticus]POB47081.1 hypothetical protein CRN52_13465 [Vibrio vulnificus]CAH1599618.1 conserved exported hypothetical protein [Vibrio jasicida]
MNRINTALTALALAASVSGNALADDPLSESVANSREQKLTDFFSITANADWTAKLPETGGMVLTKLKNGNYVAMGSNMRYAFEVKRVVNIMNGEEVLDLKTANDLWLVYPEQVQKMPLPMFRYGPDKPKADITIMAPVQDDKASKSTVEFVKEHMDKFTIDVILMATTNKVAGNSVAHLMCAMDRKLAKERYLDMKFPIKEDVSTHLEQNPQCNVDDIISTFTLQRMYNVKTYPFTYNSHGATVAGLPENLEQFLDFKPENLASIQGLDWSKN